jgi:hypothetical protein
LNSLFGEAILSDNAYSAKEEKRALDALGRGLLKEFPNPERIGCPGSEVLRGIASRKVPLAQAEPWLDHLTSCSPCYRDFSQFREAYELARKRMFLAVAASILIVASIAGWALAHRHEETQYAQTAVLDLRNRSVSRGTEPNPGEPPLELSRAVSHLNVYLPLGSPEGPYEVRIVGLSGEPLASANGIAKVSNYIPTLPVTINLSSSRPGGCILQVRKVGLEGSSYPLLLR